MDLDLLVCSICPKKPSFSDTSHLLTHVGSKGHLSHLHKLQVRSHQEIEAGVQLATYNQWYQHHGLARLLSERMVTKEAKKAGRRKVATSRGAYVTERNPVVPVDETLLLQALPKKRTAKSRVQSQKKTRSRRSKQAADDDSDFEYSPSKRSRPRRAHTRSPVKGSPSFDHGLQIGYEPLTLATPEHTKLKGTIWPGMDLFDAATEEMRKKRNQRKDGSVVRRMERLSALVEPTEVVYSPGGNIRKARHIDDLEDTSSLIDGETPLPKPKHVPSRKRQPFAILDANAPRLVKRRIKGKSPKKRAEQPFGPGIPSLPYLPSSSTGDSFALGSRFPALEDEYVDFKPTVNNGSARKRSSHFTIFEDGSPGYGPTTPLDHRRNPFQTGPQAHTNTSRQQLPAVSAPWLKPQHQSALQNTTLYNAHRPMSQGLQSFCETANSKENVAHLGAFYSGHREFNANPLSWRSPEHETAALATPSESPFGNLFNLFPFGGHHDDPFVTTKNPLAEALEHFDEEESQPDIKLPIPRRPDTTAEK
ncbi:hypothetical protein LTR10_020358 [Elasticomyces elasticus]|uniref:U1-type domain-containing protein n=1 Tax=Exophiala sideris TaxID=1016849 RepID=A0ABR0JBP0_9EURO|nr:hypothetical protein LTR10_020358 [Elasticomyces elasticus]KAK5022822.1 hypothetical protein LTS07_009800 [Exophiala sideris]KAK5026724.1 hypothetical protein LTR13_009948 [Exophiala sideris]KAK5059449.1 hypothetical protein LTR69_006038 [Exophiala sideris]KAK5177407.1 hypothetical protein LTR44_010022 [Eurotiomycetes sp. CCFEE 6388]